MCAGYAPEIGRSILPLPVDILEKFEIEASVVAVEPEKKLKNTQPRDQTSDGRASISPPLPHSGAT